MSKFGCFEKCVTKEEADFWRPTCGDMVDKMVGKKCCFKSCDMGNGKVFSQWTFEGCPEMNCSGMFCEGVENKVNLPHLGGQCCIKYHQTEKGYKSCINSPMGKFELDETYCPQGMKAVITMDGKSCTEHWKRVIEVDGMYKCTKQTNTKEFMKAEGLPDSFICLLDDYSFCVKVCDKNIRMVENFGPDCKQDWSVEFDKEFDYKFPVEGSGPNGKMIATNCGNGKYVCVFKDDKGSCTEWTYQFCGKGAKVCGKNLKTGACCEMEFIKECCPIAGTWKPISVTGCADMLCAIGLPKAEAQKYENDRCHRLCFKECGPIVHCKMTGDLSPVDMCFKWGEECEYFDPLMKENCKCVNTKNGNTVVTVTKTSCGTWHTKMTVGNCFMTSKICLEGCPLTMTTIYEREC